MFKKLKLFFFSTLTEVHGKIAFCLPFLEVGASTRKLMNVSAEWKGMFSYNLNTGEYNEEYQMPKKMEEVMYSETRTAHYIKSSREPIRKIALEVDQFGKVTVSTFHFHLSFPSISSFSI